MAGYELTFRQTSATTASLELSYDIGGYETGSEHFTYHATKPANVIKETRRLATKAGRMIQFGIVLAPNGSGRGVAWPA